MDEPDGNEDELDEDEFDDIEIIEEDDPSGTEHAFRGAEFASGLLIGVVAGAVIALLFAPQAGPRTRRGIGRRVRRLRSDAEDRWDHAQRDLRKQVRRRKRKIQGKLDKVTKRTRKAVKRLT